MSGRGNNDNPDLTIVGLNSSTNGRSCTRHDKCGDHVCVGDVLRLVRCVVTIKGEPEEAIKLVKIEDATDSCTVAFIDRVSASNPKVIQNINKFAQVVEIIKDSTNTHKRRMAKQNYGMATIFFLDDIPIGE